MKSAVSSGLLTHFGEETTTIATLWKLTRAGSPAEIFGFTDHDRDIVYNGLTYEAESGVTTSQISTAADLSVDNLELFGIIVSSIMTEDDLEAGVWDGAEVVVSQVNYNDLGLGELIIRVGELGQVRKKGGEFIAEARGLMDKLQKQITRAYLPSCDADLGDDRCGVDLTSFTHSLTVTDAVSRSEFSDSGQAQAMGYFDYGVIRWLTGLNTGRSMEIKSFRTGNAFELQLPMPYEIQVGDTATVIAGCDKTFETCKLKFNNVVNFRGFPHVPGIDDLLTPGGA